MYSEDFKNLAINLYNKFSSLRKVAQLLNIHYSTISVWINKIIKPRKIISKKLDNIEVSSFIKNTINKDPFCPLKNIQNILNDTFKLSVSTELIRLHLKNNNYTKKKVKYYSSPKDLEEKTSQFILKREQFIKENRNFISILKFQYYST